MEPLGTNCVGITYRSGYGSTPAYSFQSNLINVHSGCVCLHWVCVVQTSWYKKDNRESGQFGLGVEPYEICEGGVFTFSSVSCLFVL